MRREMVRAGVDVLAGIGTSSSYCMPEFGQRLGEDAVGLFASDKPDSGALDDRRPDGRRPWSCSSAPTTRTAERFDATMSAAALAGFSGAWALLHHVLPDADGADARPSSRPPRPRRPAPGLAAERERAARSARRGRRPPARTSLAESVIWQWTEPGEHWVVWPDRVRDVRGRGDRPVAVTARRRSSRLGVVAVARLRRRGGRLGAALAARAPAVARRARPARAVPLGRPARRELAADNLPPTPGTSGGRSIRGGNADRPCSPREDAQVDAAPRRGRVRRGLRRSDPASRSRRSLDLGDVGSPAAPLEIVGNVVRIEARP